MDLFFRYKGKKYKLFFFPCGKLLRITSVDNGKDRELKFDSTTKFRSLLLLLDNGLLNY